MQTGATGKEIKSTADPLRGWLVAMFAVPGGFVLGGICGAMVGGLAGVWDYPLEGFFAAFAWVAAAYLAAPSHRRSFAAFAWIAGAAIAWVLLKHAYYPERHPLAYQPTYLPLYMTYAGGLLALALACLHDFRSRRLGS
jgi:peptidoglycan/LPS O-acetylase OafA/YrhL